MANEAKAAATGRSGNADAVQLDDAEAVQVVVFGGSFPGMLGMGPGWGRPVQGGRSRFFSLGCSPPCWEYFLQGGCILTWLHFFCGKCWLMYTIPWNSMGTGNTPSKRSMFQASTLAYQSVWVPEKQPIFAIKQNWKVSIEIPWW